MKIFEMDYLDIPIEEYKTPREIIVCLDSHKRIGEKTWAVIRSVGDHACGTSLGFFYEQKHAILFAGTVDTLNMLPPLTN